MSLEEDDDDLRLSDDETTGETFDATELFEDVQQLKSVWLNELFAPELLDFQEELVKGLLEQMENQQTNVDTANEERIEGNENDVDSMEVFACNLYQMEIDRIRYLIAAYLRVRLVKIQKYVIHILNEYPDRLWIKEFTFATDYLKLHEGHLKTSFLDYLPDKMQSISSPDMIPKPDLDKYVFCHALEDIGEVPVDDGGETIVLNRNDTFLMQYSAISPFLRDGRIALV